MPRQPKSKDRSLGKGLIKSHKQRRHIRPDTNSGAVHTNEIDDGFEWAKFSITDQTNLDEFLTNAQLAGREFTAERQNIKIVDPKTSTGLLSDTERRDIEERQRSLVDLLRVPRRPKWDLLTTPEELKKKEMEDFLEWRRSLALFEESQQQKSSGQVLLTPFEKNLEFWRQLWRVLERSDVIVQIVDARNPLQFYCEDLFKYSAELSEHKLNMVLLNKADLLTPNQREAWIKYFHDKGVIAICFSALEQGQEELSDDDEDEQEPENDTDIKEEDQDQDTPDQQPEAAPESEEESEYNSDDYEDYESEDEADDDKLSPVVLHPTQPVSNNLFSRRQLTKFWRKLHDPSKPKCKVGMTTIGLVGYPNVGKSSTINALLQDKKVSVSATPGKTKHFQTILLDEDLMLCDCPGLVFPNFATSKADMIINGILPIDQMKDHVPPVSLVATLIPRHILQATYGIILPDPTKVIDEDMKKKIPPTAEQLLNAYGSARGFMTARGLPDNPRSARVVLKDFVNGKLLYCWAPPGMDQDEFHQFPLPERFRSQATAEKAATRDESHMTRNQRILHSDGHTDQTFNEHFFAKANSRAHVRGFITPGITGDIPGGSATATGTKPWKKHNNRNKKEKLRRVYRHLDEC